jgi:hypothetical protein
MAWGRKGEGLVLPFIEHNFGYVRLHQQVAGGKVSTLASHFLRFLFEIGPWSEYEISSLIYALQFWYRTWGDSGTV